MKFNMFDDFCSSHFKFQDFLDCLDSQQNSKISMIFVMFSWNSKISMILWCSHESLWFCQDFRYSNNNFKSFMIFIILKRHSRVLMILVFLDWNSRIFMIFMILAGTFTNFMIFAIMAWNSKIFMIFIIFSWNSMIFVSFIIL